MSILPRTFPKFPVLSERGEECLRAASYCDLVIGGGTTTDKDIDSFENARIWLLKLATDMEGFINSEDSLPTVLDGKHPTIFEEKGSYEFLLDLIGMHPPGRVSMPLGAGGRLSSLISAYNINSSEEFGRAFREALERFMSIIPQKSMRSGSRLQYSPAEMKQARDLFIRAHTISIAETPYDYPAF